MKNKNDCELSIMRPHLKYNIIEQWHSLQEKYDFLCPWWLEDKRYRLKCFFFPKTKWIRKAVDGRWHDLDYCFSEILFAGIINYVEGEKCFETIMWVTPQEKRHKKKIEEIYKWAKTGRKELQDKIENAYPPIENPITLPMRYASPEDNKKTYEELYGEVNRLEKLLYDTDTQYLTWLIKCRNSLWT
jgi:hypothetical protein